MIKIYIEFEGKRVLFPVNPEKIKIKRAGNNGNEEVVLLGEILLLRQPRLAEIEIEAFFPKHSYDFVIEPSRLQEPQFYVDFINLIRSSKKPCRIIITDTEINMLVGIDGFEYYQQFGDFEDIYYTLELQEYKPFEAKKVIINKETKKEETKVEREVNKPKPGKTYTVVKGDSLWKITKKLTGTTNWKPLYELNKSIIGSNPNKIYPKQVFQIPNEWIK